MNPVVKHVILDFGLKNESTSAFDQDKNNISLNMKLLHLPDNLIDYILLHELVHTRVKNHGINFWNELETVVPNARNVDRQLREYQYCLF